MTTFRTNKNKKVYPISNRRMRIETYQKGTAHLGVPKTLSESYRMKKLDKIQKKAHDKYVIANEKILSNSKYKVGEKLWLTQQNGDVREKVHAKIVDAKVDNNVYSNYKDEPFYKIADADTGRLWGAPWISESNLRML